MTIGQAAGCIAVSDGWISSSLPGLLSSFRGQMDGDTDAVFKRAESTEAPLCNVSPARWVHGPCTPGAWSMLCVGELGCAAGTADIYRAKTRVFNKLVAGEAHRQTPRK